MYEPHLKRSISEIQRPSRTRCYPVSNITHDTHGNFTGTLGDLESRPRTPRRDCSHKCTVMPCNYHEDYNRRQTHETMLQSHGPQCQYQQLGCACCPTLPYLNSPYKPISSSMGRVAEISRPPNNTRLSSTLHEPLTGTHTPTADSAVMPNFHTRPFASRGVDFMPTYNPTVYDSEHRDVASQVSTTPQSVFSAVNATDGSRLESGGYGTPDSIYSASDRLSSMRHAMSPTKKSQEQMRNIQGSHEALREAQELSTWSDPDSDWLAQTNIYTTPALDHNINSGDDHFNGWHSQDPTTDQDRLSAILHQSSQEYVHDPEALPDMQADPLLGQHYLEFPTSLDGLDAPPFEVSNGFPTAEHYSYDTPRSDINTYHGHNFDFNQPLNDAVQFSAYRLPHDYLPSNTHSDYTSTVAASNASGRGRQSAKNDDLDRKLVEWRNAGLSYKEIMQKGEWGLEESTLRGRYRTLTKPKEKRMRKPTWNPHSVSC